jgi:hypothetical protein
MTEEFEISQGKSAGELGYEALWFFAHTLFAIVILAIIVIVGLILRLDQDAIQPKVIGTLCAILIPMVGGFIIAKIQQNMIARYVWISGLLIFSVVCVWVLDLPTGNGLCEHCGALEKLWRTFFTFTNGSGLMGGDGVLIGAWVPLAIICYSIGARMGLDEA